MSRPPNGSWNLSKKYVTSVFWPLINKKLLFWHQAEWPLFCYLHQQFIVLITNLCAFDATHRTWDTWYKTAHFLFMCVCASVRVVMYFFLVLFQKLFFVVYWALKSSYIKRVKIRCELILPYKWKVRKSRSSNFTGMCLYDTNPKELQILLRNTFGPRSSSILVYHFFKHA